MMIMISQQDPSLKQDLRSWYGEETTNLVSKYKKSRYILVGFRSLLAICLDKGWGNPDRNAVAQAITLLVDVWICLMIMIFQQDPSLKQDLRSWYGEETTNLVSKYKKSSYILVGFRSLLAICLDKGWGNPDRNVVAQTLCCW